MARARNIKPGFFKNERLADCHPLARILYAGLWCEADREGRLEDRPRRLKAEYLPYDDCDPDALLNQLEKAGFVVRYIVDGSAFIAIPAFNKHQNPHMREPASSIPEPVLNCAGTVPDSEQDGAGPADSPSLIPDSPMQMASPPCGAEPTADNVGSTPSGDQKQSKRRKVPEAPLPADFKISDAVRSWARRKGFDRLDEHLEAFCNKARAKGYRYADWDAAFMEAVRGDWAKLRETRFNGANQQQRHNLEPL